MQSNTIKTRTFCEVLQRYDPVLVAFFVKWHKANGGVSRFEKFAHFFRDILNQSDWESQTKAACVTFGDLVSKRLLTCPTVPGLEALLSALQSSTIPLAVNTGGAQDEIREVLEKRGLAKYFEIILGSPATKHSNMITLRDKGFLVQGGCYLGDSRLDWELAKEFDMHFIYVALESEWQDGTAVTLNARGVVAQDLTQVAQTIGLPVPINK